MVRARQLSGEGGIRTLDGRNRPYRFSRPAHSTALPPLRGSAENTLASAGGEERPEQLGGVLGQQARFDLRPVVQKRLPEDVEHAARGAGLWIERAEHDA